MPYLVQEGLDVHVEGGRPQKHPKLCQHLLLALGVLPDQLAVDLVEGLEDELDEGALGASCRGLAAEGAGVGMEVDVAPEPFGKLLDVP